VSDERIYMSAPDVGDLEERAVTSAIRSGWVAPLGPEVDAFERDVAHRIGVAQAVALSSGTAALHLGLLGLGAGPGDVVITSTMTFAATANAITYVGATPFFVDSEPSTGNMDPELLRSAIKRVAISGRRVAAIIPVDLLGKAADYASIEPIARDAGIPVFADAAESLGASYRSRPAGSFGHASVLSFNGNKVMTTSGGGMLLTDDEDLAGRTRYLATQARMPAAHYEHTEIGYNYRLSNLLAALGRAQLSRLDGMIARRRELRERYRELFSDVAGVEIFGGIDDAEDNAWLTAVLVDPKEAGWGSRALADALEAVNIESRPLWKPMHLQPVFASAPAVVNGTAERLFETGVTLPSGSALTSEQVDRVIDAIHVFLTTR
jgi:dTDP-4-amino-4,6-dideoxygalactose transaminase